jgi:integrase
MTFTSFVEGPITSRYLPTLSEAHRYTVENAIKNHILPVFGSLKLEQISRGKLDDYLARVRKVTKEKGQAEYLGYMRRFLSLAMEWELLSAMPTFPKVKVPKADIPEFLTPEEHRTLLAHARDHEEYTLLLFATDSGTRSGEQLAFQWGDILASQLVLARSVVRNSVASGFKGTKSGKPRVLPLSQRLEAALTKMKAERQARGLACLDTDLVFGSYIPSVKALYRRVIWACKRAQVKATSRHGLRHTYASWLISQGVSLAQVQALLGHSSPNMTLRYAHLIPGTGDNVRAVLDGLSNATSSPGPEKRVDNGVTTEVAPTEPNAEIP